MAFSSPQTIAATHYEIKRLGVLLPSSEERWEEERST